MVEILYITNSLLCLKKTIVYTVISLDDIPAVQIFFHQKKAIYRETIIILVCIDPKCIYFNTRV